MKNFYILDAKDKILGRLASRIAHILMGKHKVEYLPHIDIGDYVIVINAKKIKLSGKKLKNKYYYHHTGYIGHLKKIRYDELLEKKPEFILYLAVKRMLCNNKLRNKRLKRLFVYADENHPHIAQQPQPLAI